MIKYTGTANAAVMGMVSTQERKISFNTSHLTLDNLSPAPAPMMDILTTCVVLTGPPNKDALTITKTAAN